MAEARAGERPRASWREYFSAKGHYWGQYVDWALELNQVFQAECERTRLPSLPDVAGVDRLSLYLSLRDMEDERIEAALDQMMKEVPW